MGKIAAQCLLAMRKNESLPQLRELKPFIVERQSLSQPQ
jgi:DNA-binding LacI/PurR family transcriptional regulator